MFFCAAGDIHGALDRLYEDVFAFETLLGVRFAYVLHVGDFGIWPDANRIEVIRRVGDRMRTAQNGPTRVVSRYRERSG
jgi:hypothetical protein